MIPDFIANCGMARVFAFLMGKNVKITDDAIFQDVSNVIYKALEKTPQEALNGTSVLNTIALQKGAKILRVHDVKEAVECIKLVSKLK